MGVLRRTDVSGKCKKSGKTQLILVMSAALDKYEVKFYRNSRLKKNLSTNNDSLTLYITDHDSIYQINGLLDDIKGVLNDLYAKGGGYTQGMICSVIDQ